MAMDKQISEKNEASSQMRGGHDSGEENGPTGSCRTYPKGSKVPTKADFNPMEDKRRGATDLYVGGV